MKKRKKLTPPTPPTKAEILAALDAADAANEAAIQAYNADPSTANYDARQMASWAFKKAYQAARATGAVL